MSIFKGLSKKEKAKYIFGLLLYPIFMVFNFLEKKIKFLNTYKSRIVAGVVTLTMVLGMVPLSSLSAFAESVNEVYVGGEYLNAENKYGITNSWGVMITEGANESNYNVKYDAETETLTLKNANIKRAMCIDETFSASIICKNDLNIKLADNTVNYIDNDIFNKYPNSYGIYVEKKLTLSGGGELNVKSGKASIESVAIYSDDSLTVDNGTINTENGKGDLYGYGIYCNTTFLMNNGTINTICGNSGGNAMGIYCEDKMHIKGGIINVTGLGTCISNMGLYTDSSFIIDKGKINIIFSGGENNNNICLFALDQIMINDGEITCDSSKSNNMSYGIQSSNGITINGGIINSSTKYCSVSSDTSDIIVNGGTVTMMCVGEENDNTATTNRINLSNYPKYKITASINSDGSSPVTEYNEDDILTYKYIKIEPIKYNLWVGGVQINSTNANDVFNDGTVSYNADTSTLTLNNYTYAGKGVFNGSYNSCIFYPENNSVLTVELKGENIITSTSTDSMSCAFYTYGKLTLQSTDGTGSLKCFQTKQGTWHYGLGSFNILTINSGNIEAISTEKSSNSALSNDFGIYNYSGIIMNGGTLITAGDTRAFANAMPNLDNYANPYITVGDNLDGSDAHHVNVIENNPEYKYIKIEQKAKQILTAGDFTYKKPTNLVYDGTAKTATVNINKDEKLTTNVKYYKDGVETTPINVGTYTVKINCDESTNYNAAIGLTDPSWTFTIAPKELTEYNLSITGINDEIYTQEKITPEPLVKYGDSTLIRNTDYDVLYENNTDIGTATVHINFKENYSGNIARTFEIDYGTATDDMYTITQPNKNGWYNNAVSAYAKTGYHIGGCCDDGPLEFYECGIGTPKTDGEYPLNVYFKRDSDGKIYKFSRTCKIDTTTPQDVKIQYNSNGFKSFLNTITFGLFFKKNVEITATATDNYSGIDTIQYYASDSKIEDTSTITDWKDSLTLTQNSKKIVYIKVTDMAGNYTVANNEGVVCYSDSTINPTSTVFDLDPNKQANIDISMVLNDNTLREIKNGNTTLTKDKDYTVNGNTVTISKDYLKTFAKDTTVTLTFVFNPMGVDGNITSDANIVITIKDTTPIHHERINPTCTENGTIEYWTSTENGKLYSNETCKKEITQADTVIPALGHSFTHYVYNNDATYFEDGTETAHCDHEGCNETDTRTAIGSKLIDNIKPTVQITIGEDTWSVSPDKITSGLFFNNKQNVNYQVMDSESGIDKVYYYIAVNNEVSDLNTITWTNGNTSSIMNLEPNNSYIVYVKAVDCCGNKTIVNSNRIVIDDTAPQISIEDGKTYCGPVNAIVMDKNLDTVTIDGTTVTTDEYGKFSIAPKDKPQTVLATDKAGNSTSVTITVNDSHTWGDGVVTTPATAASEGVITYTCTVCGEKKTEAIPKLKPEIIEGKNGKFNKADTNGLTFRSNAAFSDFINVSVDGNVIGTDKYTIAEGSIIVNLNKDYLTTLPSGAHTLDIKSQSGTAHTEFTIEEKANNPSVSENVNKPSDTQTPKTNTSENKSPKTGDNSDMALWIVILFISGGVFAGLGISKNKIKYNRH